MRQILEMRSKFPIFWVVQFAVLTALGLASLFTPLAVVEFLRGEAAPPSLVKPDRQLAEWTLRITRLPVPGAAVQDYFRNPAQEAADEPGIGEFHRPNVTSRQALADWLLSSTLAEGDHPPDVQTWLSTLDELPVPSLELRERILAMQAPEPPPVELNLMILQSRQTLPVSWSLAADQVRLSASCILAAALFTLFGMLSPPIRRPLARSFVLAILFLTIAMLLSSLGPPEWNLTHGAAIGGLVLGVALVGTAVRAAPKVSTGRLLWLVLGTWWALIVFQASKTPYETNSPMARRSIVITTGLMALLGMVNAHYWLVGPREDPPQDDAGIAQRRPPQLWTLWLLQFAILLLVGFMTLVFPIRAAELFMSESFDYLTTDIVNDGVRHLGAWVIALALFSYFALGVAQDWVWQSIAWIFCSVFAILALSTLINTQSGEYSIWGYLYGFQGVVFIPVTLLLLLKRDPWSKENVERIRWHWGLADLAVAMPLLWNPLWHGQRAVFRAGVGARGRLRVFADAFHSDDATSDGATNGIPDHPFFQPGVEFPVEIRFANRSQDDDAALDIRGCAIRLSHGTESPLDLLFETGAFAPASCLIDFRKLLPGANVRRNVLRHQVFREGLAAGMRRAPDSFASLSFYHPTVLEWQTSDAGHYLVRFRLIPSPEANAAAEGLPDEEDLQHLWQQKRRSDETRDGDYLRKELRSRLRDGSPVIFHLQAQFHLPSASDSLDWYNPALEWDERAQKWCTLAELRIDQPLSESASVGLRFDPANLPPSLRVPKPDNEADVYDPRSLAAAQYRVSGPLGRLRAHRKGNSRELNSTAADEGEPPLSEST